MAAPIAAAAVTATRTIGVKRMLQLMVVAVLVITLIPGFVAASVAYPIVLALNTGPSLGSGGAGSGEWVVPVQGNLTSPFGPRAPFCTEYGCTSSFHKGQDWGAACGTPIVAASAGTVVRVGDNGGWGQSVSIEHVGGITTQYNHLQDYLTRVGARVAAGTVIGTVGETGYSDGCHLDFMVINLVGLTDPLAFLRAHGVNL